MHITLFLLQQVFCLFVVLCSVFFFCSLVPRALIYEYVWEICVCCLSLMAHTQKEHVIKFCFVGWSFFETEKRESMKLMYSC